MKSENNLSRGAELITQWFVGTVFVGFRFDSNFTLFFERQAEGFFEGNRLPWQVSIEFLEDWWIGCEIAWSKRVLENGVGVEPDEPIKALELAKLRWSEGATVESIYVDERKLSIFFENGTTLHAMVTEEGEFSYSICTNVQSSKFSSCSLTFDREGFHFNSLMTFREF